MRIGVRGDQTSRVKTLFDSTHPDHEPRSFFVDDPTPLCGQEMDLWYMIAEVCFGEEPMDEQEWTTPLARSKPEPRKHAHRPSACFPRSL